MSLKMKLTSTIIAFFLVLGLVIMGVMAAPSATVNLGGTITFQATDVYALVNGTVTGSNPNPTLDELEFVAGDDLPDMTSWSNANLVFDDAGSEIEIAISIKNQATDRDLYANITYTGTATNVTAKIDDAEVTTTGMFKIEAGQTEEVVLTLGVEDKNAPISGNYGYTVYLSNGSDIATADSYSDTLKFTYNTTNNKATVYAAGVDPQGDPGENTYNITGDVVIPSFVKNGEKIYEVTTIGSFAFGFPDSSGCTLNSITIPNTITTINSAAFSNCKFPTDYNLIIPASVTQFLGSGTFMYIEVDTITFLGDSSFEDNAGTIGDANINRVVVGEGMFQIPDVSQSSIKEIVLPSTISIVSTGEFVRCNNLTSIYYRGTPEQWNAITNIEELNIPAGATIYYNYTAE